MLNPYKFGLFGLFEYYIHSFGIFIVILLVFFIILFNRYLSCDVSTGF